MPNQKIPTKRFVEDFRSGLSDALLGSKYGLTINQLHSVYSKLMHAGALTEDEVRQRHRNIGKTPPKRKRQIDAREFVEDVQLGMDDQNLMLKYDLSDRQLESLFKQLVASRVFSEAELYNRSLLADTQTSEAIRHAQQAVDELD